MILALMIGKSRSRGFKGKNTKKILGKRSCEYPIIAARKSKYIDEIYISTDCEIMKKTLKKYKVINVDRPSRLYTDKALGDDVFRHCYFEIKKKIKPKKIEFIVLLFANAVTVNSKLIDKGISLLRKNKNSDSAVSVSRYNMWSPLRARKIDKKGHLKPFIKFEHIGNPKTMNCDRDSQGDVMFADMSVSVVRPKCLENMKDNLLPQKWMGNKILPIKSDFGFDLDYEWQIPQATYWIKKNVKSA